MPNLKIDGYSIIKRIGTGARTSIYLARDETTEQTVALKRAVMETPDDTRIFEQMAAEYNVSQNIDHPYIRKCLKIIKKRKLLRVEEVILTMEMFEGQSLEERESLSLGDILLVFRMVASGLNAMHQAGFIHCDIKPNNILISPECGVKIIDLGQSCKIGTVKKRIQGTPAYIAPEQVLREHLSHRTDIFNLGATMYWALTGKNIPTMIPNKSDVGMLLNEKTKFKSPHEIYHPIPKKISDMVMQCIRKKPSERPGNMSEIIATIDKFIREIFASRNETDATTNN